MCDAILFCCWFNSCFSYLLMPNSSVSSSGVKYFSNSSRSLRCSYPPLHSLVFLILLLQIISSYNGRGCDVNVYLSFAFLSLTLLQFSALVSVNIIVKSLPRCYVCVCLQFDLLISWAIVFPDDSYFCCISFFLEAIHYCSLPPGWSPSPSDQISINCQNEMAHILFCLQIFFSKTNWSFFRTRVY